MAVGYMGAGISQVPLAERWNGSSWSDVTPPSPAGSAGSALQGVSCISATACVAVGSYVDGDGDNRAWIERWTAGVWSQETPALVSGTSAEALVGVSCTSADACTAVGYSGAEPFAQLIERWDGTSWGLQTAVPPPGATGGQLSGVSCSSATACMAVGQFYDASFRLRPIAEKWNATRWMPQTTPVPPGATDVEAFFFSGVSCTADDACTVTGFHGQSEPFADRWNGKDWALETISQPADGVLLGVSCVDASTCTGVGAAGEPLRTLAEGWGGPGWQPSAPVNPSGAVKLLTLFGVSCAGSNTCLAGGAYENSSGSLVPIAEGFNGSSWRLEPTLPSAPAGTLNAASCWAAKQCFVAGVRINGSGVGVPLAEQWNGSAWTERIPLVPHDSVYAELKGVSCTSATDCAVVGFYRDSVGVYQPLAEHWDGKVWRSELIQPPPQTTATVLNGVSCAAPGQCTAVGNYDFGGTERTLVETRTSAGWVWTNSPNPDRAQASNLYGISCTSVTSCTAAGSYSDSSDRLHPLAERLAGATWAVQATAPLGGTTGQFYAASCPNATACAAAGSYFTPSEVSLAERWDGLRWNYQDTVDPTAAARVVLYGVSCSTAVTCTAVGFSATSSGAPVLLAEEYS